jgi:hypothetical protein
MVVERTDNVIWMLSRTMDGIGESFSTDFGCSWSKPRPSSIGHVTSNVPRPRSGVAPVGGSRSSRFHIRRLHSRRLLLVKHGTRIDQGSDRRSHLTAYLSDDDGATWSAGFLLDERHQISYPDVALSADGYLYIQYDRNRADDGEILFARITEKDIISGRVASEKSELRKVVSRPRRKKA